MIQYILECIAFQLVFLVIYDFFLKRETFFQWNRFYLLSTFVVSLVLPLVKIEAFKTTVEQPYIEYGESMWGLNNAINLGTQENAGLTISWQMVLFGLGVLVSALLLVYKLRQLYLLRAKGDKISFKEFTQILVPNSSIAFSFFKSIFIGDKVSKTDYTNIIAHELVHIKQGHSWDLLFFELMRIIGWFNPLVYVYQSRISELHEFIADAKVSKSNKNEQYQLLLSQVFQTQNISFINHFFKSSLIKKRIVMLQKSQSKSVFKLKYLALLPLVLGMLFYSSCENETNDGNGSVNIINVDDIENLTVEEENNVYSRLFEFSKKNEPWSLVLKDENSTIEFSEPLQESSFISGPNGFPLKAKMQIKSNVLASDFSLFESKSNEINLYAYGKYSPFSVVEEVPVFPGCEGDTDKRACFQQMMQEHISKNFSYPQAAQQLGIEGRVSVMFIIQKDGSIGNVRMRGPDKLLEDEVARIIAKLPKMNPGKQDGKFVNVPFSIPIAFKLEQSNFDITSSKSEQSSTSQVIGDEIMDISDLIAFAMIEEVPIFPGCEGNTDKRACFQQSIQTHIGKYFNYPEEAQEHGIQGRVNVVFIIQKDGSIGNVRMRGPDKLLEQEAERIIAKLPKMTPGRHNGKQVNVPYSIPITFKLR